MQVEAGRSFKLLLAVALGSVLMCGTSSMVVAALGTTIEREMRLSHTLLGVIQSGFFVGNGLGSILVAVWMQRVSLKTIGLCALGLLVLGNLLSAVPVFPSLVAGRACMGFANSGMILFVSTLIVHLFPGRQSALLSLVHATVSIGSGIGMLITVPLMGAFGAWSWVPFLLALLAIGMFALQACFRGPVIDPEKNASGYAPVGRLLVSRPIRAALFLMFLYILAEMTVIVFVPIYLQTARGMGLAAAARSGAVFIVGVALGRIVLTGAGQRHAGAGQIVAFALAGAASVLAALFLPLPVGGVTLLLLAGGALMGPTAPLAVSFTVQHADFGKNAALAVSNLVMCIGGVAGSVATGALCDGLGLRAGIGFSVAAFLIGSLLLYGMPRTAASGVSIADRVGKTKKN